jgi:hypothetical protein
MVPRDRTKVTDRRLEKTALSLLRSFTVCSYSSLNSIKVNIEDEMSSACSTSGREKSYNHFNWKT